MKLLRYLFLFSTFALLLSACGTGTTDSESSTAKRYPFRGEIVKLDKPAKKATIAHEKIEGYMDAMTMDLEIRKPDWVWNELVPGSIVTGELVVDNVNGDYWVEVSGVIAPKDTSQNASPLREDVASVGKQLIEFKLTNQDGKSISPKDFAGKSLAITFIYSQCPLPEFCILMSKNFSDAANVIAKDERMSKEFRLLSISFDPARDTPEKLRNYGLGYLGKDSGAKDFSVWQLAVGESSEIRKIADFAGLRYEVDEKDETQFRHSLRTLVVSPNGKIKKVLSGNDWKPADLIEALESAGKAEDNEE